MGVYSISRFELQQIRQSARSLGLTLDEEQCDRLASYHDLVRDWNARINLVSRRDVDNLLADHIIDSMAAIPLLSERGAPCDLMDLGPGGGFPGIPLKICLPHIKLTCLEATQKKARFIELAAKELNLSDVLVIARHSQEAQKDKSLLDRYDFVTARAVAELKELVKMSFPFLKRGGALLAYKSSKAREEMETSVGLIGKLGGKVMGEYRREESNKDRRIIVIRKMA